MYRLAIKRAAKKLENASVSFSRPRL